MEFISKNTQEKETYSIYRMDSAKITKSDSSVLFSVNIQIKDYKRNIFLGMIDESQKFGVAISINPLNGEVQDLINGLGIIGFLNEFNNNSIQNNKQNDYQFSLNIQKYSSVFLPEIVCNSEIFLHPSLYLDNGNTLSAYVGNAKDTNNKHIKSSKNKKEVALN